MPLPSPFKEIKGSDLVTLKWRGRTWEVSTEPNLIVSRVTKRTYSSEPLVRLWNNQQNGKPELVLMTYDAYLKLERWAKEAAT
jgi:hypothetical protein